MSDLRLKGSPMSHARDMVWLSSLYMLGLKRMDGREDEATERKCFQYYCKMVKQDGKKVKFGDHVHLQSP